MQTKTFSILKKNRKYFSAKLNGYKCKILIDKNSENLEVGCHNLIVEDKSVRSKYGTDLIFALIGSPDEQQEAGITSLKHPYYNKDLVQRCRDLGGKWDEEQKAWIFTSIVEDKVEQLDAYYNSVLINCKLFFDQKQIIRDGFYFKGYGLIRGGNSKERDDYWLHDNLIISEGVVENDSSRNSQIDSA
ncbi:hypothetical protein [Endozoicomonas ascidiicola]|uniref:hypothetical protein n=1 Tax=Endozoicomonas ascidiicola TaxID=1698521 RepID=UPI00082ABAC6|nr:hypothetical protein [Endozoicomonas ascidiicola]